ncbi:MAG: hypothetical protein QOG09_1167 [Solirubrobacterales bacterium]|jgi:hypothetical protein|nr:hypothetical protein [Solirubrobacterales bacterium]MDX6652507.1 hypothetical protein [Solirubrobacterales bacterium]MDX6663065.1 hypothetical protein [Solirubrobacterales bacterium]
MGIGTSIFLVALGAVLRWAVTTGHVAGVRIHTVGLILLIVGIVGLLISLYYTEIYSRRRGTVVRDPALRDPDYVP